MRLHLDYNTQDYKPPGKVDRSVRSARILNFRTKDYSFLRFYTNIADLIIRSYGHHNLDPLLPLHRLELLQIHAAPRVNDWSQLSELPRLVLVQMTIAPGNWLYGKHQVVTSFAPLAQCHRLQTLVLQGYVPRDGNLLALAQLPRLRYLSIDDVFPMSQLARFAAMQPDVTCSLLNPYRLFDRRCKKCNAGLYALNGADAETRRPLCPVCNEARLRRHLDKWRNCQKTRN